MRFREPTPEARAGGKRLGFLGSRIARFLVRKPAEKPAIPPGLRVYAIGDVHGCLDLLLKMQRRIVADLRQDPPDRSIEIYVGDYVDRGAQSREVLEFLCGQRAACDRRVCLKGNHEMMLLEALEDAGRMAAWFEYGGRETLLSYGVAPPTLTIAANYGRAQQAFREAFPDGHRRFLERLPYLVEVGGYVFVHAGIDPTVSLSDQSPEDLTWIREPFLSSDQAFERFVVHGHTPIDEPEMRPNRVNIDTGAFITGRLTCLVLEGEERRFIQVTAG